MRLFDKLFSLDKHRGESLKAKALLTEMQFSQEDNLSLVNQLSSFHLFSKGRHKRISNILSSSDGLNNCNIFDYSYVVQAGKSAVRLRQSVLFINSKSLSLPNFILKPENFIDKFLSLFGIQDINFEDNVAFSKKYNLSGEYESIIRQYFNAKVLDLLSTYNDFSLEGMNYYLILYKHKKLISPDELISFLQLGKLIEQLFLAQSKSDEAFQNDLFQNLIK